MEQQGFKDLDHSSKDLIKDWTNMMDELHVLKHVVVLLMVSRRDG